VGGQRGPDLTRIADRTTEGQLYTRIMNGGGGMPAYGNTLTPQQANQIVSFLLTLGTHNGPPSQGAGATGSPGS
jgi:ubiquinol-cytochrome c reductase cytochrome b subunit